MYTKLSEIVRISSFLQNWNGSQSSKVKTVNSKIQKYHQKNEDSLVNVTLLKILEDYDYSSYLKVLQNGVSFVYQQATYNLKSDSNNINCQIYGKNGVLSCNVKITNDSITFDKNPSNADSYSLIVSLFRENHNKVIRKVNI